MLTLVVDSWVAMAVVVLMTLLAVAEFVWLCAISRLLKRHGVTANADETEALKLEVSEYRRLQKELANAICPESEGGPSKPLMCDLVSFAYHMADEARFARSCCDSSGDRMYHAADNTWWKRVENHWVRSRKPRTRNVGTQVSARGDDNLE